MKSILISFLIMSSSLSYADIKVSGSGEIQITPNRARLSFSVITKNSDAKIASEDNEKISKKISKLLIDNLKFTNNNIKTLNYNLRPVYVYLNNQPPKFEGIEVSNDIQIKDIMTDQVSSLIKELSSQKISEIRNIEFYHNDIDSFNEECLSLAVSNARKKAEILAAKSGMKIVAVKDIHEQSSQPYPEQPMMFQAKSERMGATLYSGELAISKNIIVTFETK